MYSIRRNKGAMLLILLLMAGLLLSACSQQDSHTHSWSAATCTAPKTCRTCGETSGAAPGHSWRPATCTAPKTCTVCAETAGSASGHDWKSATCTEPKTCRTCNMTEGSAEGHEFREATFNSPSECGYCGAIRENAKTPGQKLSLRDIIWDAKATSVYSGDNLGKHIPENLYDGDLRTNWTEDAPDEGIGETVTLFFDQVYAIKELKIHNGSHYSESVYRQNCRPKVLTVMFFNAETEEVGMEIIRLKDTYDQQTFTFDLYHYADEVDVTISEVYEGTHYLDTVIAELDFAAYRP